MCVLRILIMAVKDLSSYDQYLSIVKEIRAGTKNSIDAWGADGATASGVERRTAVEDGVVHWDPDFSEDPVQAHANVVRIMIAIADER